MKSLICVILLLSCGSRAHARCLVEYSFARHQSAENLYKSLEANCKVEEVRIPSYHGSTVNVIDFYAYWEWRGGIASSYLGKCVKKSTQTDDVFDCHIFDMK